MRRAPATRPMWLAASQAFVLGYAALPESAAAARPANDVRPAQSWDQQVDVWLEKARQR